MRTGQNPAKFVDRVHQPEGITVAVLTYVPFLGGYFSGYLDVVKTCLRSIWENTRLPYDLMVFDNGSCAELQGFLVESHNDGRIQYLMLSTENLGKGGAWNIIFQAAPGEVVAYSDSDALFHPGWLDACLEILEVFPNAGMVTGRPFRTRERLMTATLNWVEQTADAHLERGNFIPWETFREFDMSLGQPESDVRERYEATIDYRVTYNSTTAHVGASHWQFVCRKEIIQQFLPLSMDRPMGQVLMLDEHVNEAGYLRLMTPQPLVMNMSNNPWSVNSGARARSQSNKIKRRLLEVRPVRRGLLWFYDKVFSWYFGEE
jgi:glycosyltransferase involved in cell wall biosynthesis